MIEVALIEAVVQVGFPVSVAMFLLYKGYTQDKEYLKALQDLSTLLREHTQQKEDMAELLKNYQEDLRAVYLGMKRYPPNP